MPLNKYKINNPSVKNHTLTTFGENEQIKQIEYQTTPGSPKISRLNSLSNEIYSADIQSKMKI